MRNITALCGGVGGAKLALGLAAEAPALSLVVNTGDDFNLYGLPICPDLDTVAYTLSGKANAEQGWGRADESFAVHTEMQALGETPWFLLGDRDIALHLCRARLLGEGLRLTEAMARIGAMLGIVPRLLPMSDQPAPTMIDTDEGLLAFQDYFVRRRCAPVAKAIHFANGAEPAPEALAAMAAADALILCPSNPLLSIAPILAVEPLRAALATRRVPALAVSPIIDGTAVKGPTAKLFAELDLGTTAVAVARRYRGLIDIFVIDERDAALAPEITALGIQPVVAPTLMRTLDDKTRLAAICLDALAAWRAP